MPEHQVRTPIRVELVHNDIISLQNDEPIHSNLEEMTTSSSVIAVVETPPKRETDINHPILGAKLSDDSSSGLVTTPKAGDDTHDYYNVKDNKRRTYLEMISDDNTGEGKSNKENTTENKPYQNVPTPPPDYYNVDADN